MPFTVWGAGMSVPQEWSADINDVVELVANAALVRNVTRPRNCYSCRVPPKCEAICLVQLNGVSKAHVQPTAMWL
jgi:hypothetical protein